MSNNKTKKPVVKESKFAQDLNTIKVQVKEIKESIERLSSRDNMDDIEESQHRTNTRYSCFFLVYIMLFSFLSGFKHFNWGDQIKLSSGVVVLIACSAYTLLSIVYLLSGIPEKSSDGSRLLILFSNIFSCLNKIGSCVTTMLVIIVYYVIILVCFYHLRPWQENDWIGVLIFVPAFCIPIFLKFFDKISRLKNKSTIFNTWSMSIAIFSMIIGVSSLVISIVSIIITLQQK